MRQETALHAAAPHPSCVEAIVQAAAALADGGRLRRRALEATTARGRTVRDRDRPRSPLVCWGGGEIMG